MHQPRARCACDRWVGLNCLLPLPRGALPLPLPNERIMQFDATGCLHGTHSRVSTPCACLIFLPAAEGGSFEPLGGVSACAVAFDTEDFLLFSRFRVSWLGVGMPLCHAAGQHFPTSDFLKQPNGSARLL